MRTNIRDQVTESANNVVGHFEVVRRVKELAAQPKKKRGKGKRKKNNNRLIQPRDLKNREKWKIKMK